MAYSSSPLTVERMLPYLEPLVEGRETFFRTEPGRSRWLAYKLREALAVAREHPERFPELARLDFRFEVDSSREVRAVPRDQTSIEVLSAPRPSAARMNTLSVGSAQDVIDHWEALSEAARTKVYMPNADLSPNELHRLWQWASEAGVIFFENAGALTLMPLDEELAPLAWGPEDLDL